MNILFCTVWQTDGISLPSAIDRIQITNYSWTREKVNEASPETSARLQQVYFAIFNALKTDENLVNLFVLSSGKEEK